MIYLGDRIGRYISDMTVLVDTGFTVNYRTPPPWGGPGRQGGSPSPLRWIMTRCPAESRPLAIRPERAGRI